MVVLVMFSLLKTLTVEDSHEHYCQKPITHWQLKRLVEEPGMSHFSEAFFTEDIDSRR